MSSLRLVSVVVIGRNEGLRLERCLKSVVAMSHATFAIEVIYVDSGSSDDSVALAMKMGAQTIALPAGRTTAARGRNAGWQIAGGDLVLFLDGDTVLDPSFVADSLDEFADPQVAIVWGHRREMHPERSIYVRVMDLDWIYAPGWTSFCGGDALFRRKVLVATGGFDESLIAGEEPELCRRISALELKILHVDRAMTMHDLAITTFSQYWRRATRAGFAYAEVSERFATTNDPFWSADAARNRLRAALLLILLAAIPLGALGGWFRWLALLAAVLLLVILAKTARGASWKTQDRATLLLYALHSQFQQLPIAWGQLQYRWNKKQGRPAKLVEYKG